MAATHDSRTVMADTPGTPWIGRMSLALVSLIGVFAFISPYLTHPVDVSIDTARSADSPLLTALLSGMCLLMLFANLGPALSSKSVALIGVLVSINALLRYLDVSFLLPGEFSPIFLLISLVGYCFGAQIGFLMGALTLLASAFITGGIGPWLPFQMFAAGWMGMLAAALRVVIPFQRPPHVILALSIYGFVWGLFYGVLLNLYNYPFLVGGGWIPAAPLWENVNRYITFYVATSLGPDLVRALGNLILMLALGLPLLKILLRFRERFTYKVITVELHTAPTRQW